MKCGDYMCYKISKIEKLKKEAKKLFKNDGEWSIVKLELQEDRRDYEHKFISSFNSLNDDKKSDVLKLVCQDKYSEEQIVYLRLTEDLSAGFALMEDDFFFFNKSKIKIRPYKEISTDNLAGIAFLFTFNGDFKLSDELCFSDLGKLKDFINIAKNL